MTDGSTLPESAVRCSGWRSRPAFFTILRWVLPLLDEDPVAALVLVRDRPGGHPMEYVGDPMEKLLGFFIAVVILTFYIGIVNLC